MLIPIIKQFSSSEDDMRDISATIIIDDKKWRRGGDLDERKNCDDNSFIKVR